MQAPGRSARHQRRPAIADASAQAGESASSIERAPATENLIGDGDEAAQGVVGSSPREGLSL
jgi:hypothetical protein